jgi:hypothetical protein
MQNEDGWAPGGPRSGISRIRKRPGVGIKMGLGYGIIGSMDGWVQLGRNGPGDGAMAL